MWSLFVIDMYTVVVNIKIVAESGLAWFRFYASKMNQNRNLFKARQ